MPGYPKAPGNPPDGPAPHLGFGVCLESARKEDMTRPASRLWAQVGVWCAAAALLPLAACGDGGGASTTADLPTSTASTLVTTTILATGLFLPADGTPLPPDSPAQARSRAVRLDTTLLLDAAGRPLLVDSGAEIPFNLFADAVYTGVVDEFTDEGGVLSWIGYLQGVEYSSFFIVHTAEVFMIHVASPLGIFEAAVLDGAIYRLYEIDQNQLPGGEG